jgi:hypothetical protein
MYFMVGEKGLKTAELCDCTKFRTASEQRVAIDPKQNMRITEDLAKQILSKRGKHRELFYILITDADFLQQDTTQQSTQSTQPTKYFPGHVIVIEKIPSQDKNAPNPSYNLYQSYIYEYDLQGQLNRNNESFGVDYDRMTHLMTQLKTVMTANTWSDEVISAWKDLTYVDTSKDFKDAICKNRFFICYKQMQARHCIERIEKYAKRVLARITREATKLKKPFKEIYGDPRLYTGDVKPLSRYEIKIKLEGLVNAIIAHRERI